MTPIEAGSPFTPIGDAPSKTESSFLLLITLALIATSLIALQSNGNYIIDNKE
jgi:hypothetical protein|tara:strand:- start:332 stop:490 length:159 start_codon:yes stop_codon:yes gene_type:complete